jgi:hypothetical protein
VGIRVHSEAEFAFPSNDDEPSHLSVRVIIVFDSGEISVVIGHRVQPVNVISTRGLSEENRKDLEDCK